MTRPPTMAAAAKRYDAALASGSTTYVGAPVAVAGSTAQVRSSGCATGDPERRHHRGGHVDVGPGHQLGGERAPQPGAHGGRRQQQAGEELARRVAGQGHLAAGQRARRTPRRGGARARPPPGRWPRARAARRRRGPSVGPAGPGSPSTRDGAGAERGDREQEAAGRARQAGVDEAPPPPAVDRRSPPPGARRPPTPASTSMPSARSPSTIAIVSSASSAPCEHAVARRPAPRTRAPGW